MSLKRLLETLAAFGFKKTDARIYIFLAKKGPHSSKDLEIALKMPRWQIYKSLRNLQKKGIAVAILHRPTLFSATSFERVIDLAAKARIEEAQQDQASTNQALLCWEKMMKENSDSATEFRKDEEEVKN